jgi:hypothetical protein
VRDPNPGLDDDWPDVLAALRRGLKDNDAGKASRAAVAYVQLVYGRQLQQKEDEQLADVDSLDVASMTREQRDELKRKLLTHTWLTSWALTRASHLPQKRTYPQPCSPRPRLAAGVLRRQAPYPPRRACAARDPNPSWRRSIRPESPPNVCHTNESLRA